MRHIKGYAPYGIPIYDDRNCMNKRSVIKPRGDLSVEFVRRWYCHVYHITIPPVNRAIDLLHQENFHFIEVNSNETPQVGDILVWKRAVKEHVAIVIKSDPLAVIVAEQNTASLNGIRAVNLHDIAGWLRAI